MMNVSLSMALSHFAKSSLLLRQHINQSAKRIIDLAAWPEKDSQNSKQGDRQGKVWLVGAGPGDAELISVRGLRLIQQAGVLVFDRLVSRELIEAAPSTALMIDVGKRPGHHPVPQAQIEKILLHHAERGKQVVRLKGGDPFIFGRGGEELQSLREAGIDTEVVPGITAASGCAAAAGFPLTHRGMADSVCLSTAHYADEDSQSVHWSSLASNPSRTLVFYMGLSKLAQISEQLIAHGMAAETPAALIENGTTSSQRSLYCQLREIDQRARAENLQTPCLLVVGKVVTLAKIETTTHDPVATGQNLLGKIG